MIELTDIEIATRAMYRAVAKQDAEEEPWPLGPPVTLWGPTLAPNPLILDIGCGWGGMVEALTRLGVSRYIGVDPCAESIEIARERYPTCDFRIGEWANLSEVVREQCDGFLAHFSFMHVPRAKADQALKSLRDVLKTGATGLILGIEGTNDMELTHDLAPNVPAGHRVLVTEWTLDTIVPYLDRAGFDVVRHLSGIEEPHIWTTVVAR